MDNVILNKSAIIENCLLRVKEEYVGFENELEQNFTKQDSIVLNIQRAIQSCMDLASHIIKENKWGIPQNSREAFDILYQNQYINKDLAENLKKMVGFRNIAVHEYKNLNLNILRNVIEIHLTDLENFKILCLNKMSGKH
jgi:uncharacterized protein YutE (UPF0331/DUF86 family)